MKAYAVHFLTLSSTPSCSERIGRKIGTAFRERVGKLDRGTMKARYMAFRWLAVHVRSDRGTPVERKSNVSLNCRVYKMKKFTNF